MMSHQQNNGRKILKVMKLKGTMIKMNSLQRLISRFKPAEERIGKLENRLIEIIQFQEPIDKRINESRQNLRHMSTKICINGRFRRRRERKRDRKGTWEAMVKHSPNFI